VPGEQTPTARRTTTLAASLLQEPTAFRHTPRRVRSVPFALPLLRHAPAVLLIPISDNSPPTADGRGTRNCDATNRWLIQLVPNRSLDRLRHPRRTIPSLSRLSQFTSFTGDQPKNRIRGPGHDEFRQEQVAQGAHFCRERVRRLRGAAGTHSTRREDIAVFMLSCVA